MAEVGGNLDSVRLYNMFDKHNVVDRMNNDEAADVGGEFHHMRHVCNVLCSHRRRHRQSTFDQNEWLPFIVELDGYVFVDSRTPSGYPVQCYQEEWMDKKQLVSLVQRANLLSFFKSQQFCSTIKYRIWN